jgi:outer membrane protein OmpA-like peptidoglycan-associated protein
MGSEFAFDVQPERMMRSPFRHSPTSDQRLRSSLQAQHDAGNQAVQHLFRSGVIQAKPVIGGLDEPEEHEADRMAQNIMRKPEGLAASCSEGREALPPNSYLPPPQASAGSGGPHLPTIVNTVVQASGDPLDTEARSFFEPKFGRDFSDVRVHTGLEAADSARAVGALAYTFGSRIVFATGQYVPNSTTGRLLLAHELTHVVQQKGPSPKAVPLRRTCDPSTVRSATGCSTVQGEVVSLQSSNPFLIQFQFACDAFQPGEESKLRMIALGFAAVSSLSDVSIRLDGFASEEGDKTFNDALSCARARKVASTLTAAGIEASTIHIFSHGATAGDRPAHRSVLISAGMAATVTEPDPTPVKPPEPVPDPTDLDIWPHWKPRKPDVIEDPGPDIDIWPHWKKPKDGDEDSWLDRVAKRVRQLKDLVRRGIKTSVDVLEELNDLREEIQDRLTVLIVALGVSALTVEGAELIGEIKALQELLDTLDELEDLLPQEPPAPSGPPTDAGVPRPAGVEDQPQPEPQPEEQIDCGHPLLPWTLVTHTGIDRGERIVANPLTRCGPHGTSTDLSKFVLPGWACITAANRNAFWVHAHLLHGKDGAPDLHGPGDQAWNLILTDKSININMYNAAEEKAITGTQQDQTFYYSVEATHMSDTGDRRFFADGMRIVLNRIDPVTGRILQVIYDSTITSGTRQVPPSNCS